MCKPCIQILARRYFDKAFTLAEMLLVIFVLAILVSLLVTGTQRVLESSREARCASNLRQLGSAVLLYAADFDGHIPPRQDVVAADEDLRLWHSRLTTLGYVDNKEIFFCPSFPPRSLAEAQALSDREWHQNQAIYGMREWHPPAASGQEEQRRPHRLNVIEKPSEFFLIADSYMIAWGTQGYFIGFGSRGRNNWRVHLRHGGKANAVFADGHVAPMAAEYFLALHETQSETNGPYYVWPEPTTTP